MRYEFWFTTAPDAYDYGHTDQVGTGTWQAYEGARLTTGRVVRIPQIHAQYQTDRYASGFHVTLKLKECDGDPFTGEKPLLTDYPAGFTPEAQNAPT